MQNSSNDEIFFLDEKEESIPSIPVRGIWKVLIVDDEPEVHSVTKLALNDFKFDQREIAFMDAYSGQEAIDMMKKYTDIAVIFLDVVMEEDDSGLKFVHFIRKELKNYLVRIILRTGQPGQAPEKRIIVDYDINDYKTKTELTSHKLFTTLVASLRTYRDMKIIDDNKKGLEKILEASSAIFEIRSLEKFITGVLYQITSLLDFSENSVFLNNSGFAVTLNHDEFFILGGTGKYSQSIGQNIQEIVPEPIIILLRETRLLKKTNFCHNGCVFYFQSNHGIENMIFFENCLMLEEWQQNLLNIFSRNVSIALDNIYLLNSAQTKR